MLKKSRGAAPAALREAVKKLANGQLVKCRMSVGAMCGVFVKAPGDLLNKPPNPQWERFSHQVISSMGRSYKFIGHRTTDIRHLISLALVNFFTASKSAGFSWNQRNTGGNTPPLQCIRL